MKENKYTNDRDANFETRITLLEHRQTTTDAIFIEIKAALMSLENKMEKGFDKIDERFIVLNNKIESGFDKFNAKLWTQFILLATMNISSFLIICHKSGWL